MSTNSKKRTLIFAPAGSGSKGDEGMIRGALRLFHSEETVLLNPEHRPWKSELEQASDFKEVYSNEKWSDEVIDEKTTVVIVGADIIDGSAGVQASLSRLEFAEKSINSGAVVFIFFSCRSDVENEIKKRLKYLSKSSLIYFFPRDELSCQNLYSICNPVNCHIFPDLAFFAYNLDLIDANKKMKRDNLTVALNFSEQSFRATRVAINDQNRIKYLYEYIKILVSAYPNSNYLLIANDIRMWHGFWSDFDYALQSKKILREFGFDQRVEIVNPIASYQENIINLQSADILIAGRMHLAIAAFIGGTLPILLTGRSFDSNEDLKHRGMYDKATGMLSWCFGRPDCVATSNHELISILDLINSNIDEWNGIIRANRLKLQSKIENSVSLLKSLGIPIEQYWYPYKQSDHTTIEALREDRFRLERENRDQLKELEIRGQYIRFLEESCPSLNGSVNETSSDLPSTEKYNDEVIIDFGNSNIFFTVCSKNFLARARALYYSVISRYPTSRFFLVLCDEVDGMIDPDLEPFKIIYLSQLQIPDFNHMKNRYNITELNTAIKPSAFLHLFDHEPCSSVIYLDPDIYVVDRLFEVEESISDNVDAILTPHILRPAENNEINDKHMLQYGIYNLGFLALRNTPNVRSFLEWWARRLQNECIISLEEGLFVDQKWADLLPSFISQTKILHHPGYNVAYWNLTQRKITNDSSGWRANGEPLRFVHFSGAVIEDKTVFSRHTQEVTMESIGDLGILYSSYLQKVEDLGHGYYSKLPYSYCWNGSKTINLHTPEELDRSKKISTSSSVTFTNPSSNIREKPKDFILKRKALLFLEAVSKTARYNRIRSQALLSIWFAYLFSNPYINKELLSHDIQKLFRKKNKSYRIEIRRISDLLLRDLAKQNRTVNISNKREAHKRIFYIDWAIPKPNQDAGSVTASLLLFILNSIGYDVTFIPASLKYEDRYYEDLKNAGVTVLVYPFIRSLNEWLQVNARQYDLCILSRGPVAWPYLQTIKEFAPDLKIIFNTVDLHYLRELRQAELLNDKEGYKTSQVLRDQEFDLIDNCNLTLILSEDELYEVRRERPEARLAVLPVVFKDIPGASNSYQKRKDILFIGSFLHKPNVDAVIYFANVVFPLINDLLPDVCFKIVGSNPPDEIKQLSCNPRIKVLGFVNDLEPIFSEIRLTVAPLRYGAGIKGKIGTSLCYGVPCVATTVAVEGMKMEDKKNILIADDPKDFACAVFEAYTNSELWNKLSTEGHEFATTHYSVQAITNKVSNITTSVLSDWCPIHNSYLLENWTDFQRHISKMNATYHERRELEQLLVPTNLDPFKTSGYCCVCRKQTDFLTSYMYSNSTFGEGRLLPNWREHMQCAECGLVNRTRAAIHLLHTHAPPEPGHKIYITEKLTQTHGWLSTRYSNVQGSEFLGDSISPGTIIDGIQHEDLMNLSFYNDWFDRVLCLDVLEHVPEPLLAFKEILRVLKPKGVFLFSVPFSASSRYDIVRSRLEQDGSITHFLPPEYHGNPVNPENGSLCYRYFGWEILDNLRNIGFSRAHAVAYWSIEQGYLGLEQYLFIAIK